MSRRQSGVKAAMFGIAVVSSLVASSLVGPTPRALAAGPTPVQGALTGAVTWSQAGSPYIVTGDIRVATGATLTIEAETVVQFAYVDAPKPYTRRAVLEVHGELNVDGEPGKLVRFSVPGDQREIGAWGGIWVNGGRAHIAYAEISYAERGIYASHAASLRVEDSMIHRCWTGIYLEDAPGGTAIERNSITGNEEGIFASHSRGHVRWNLISDNVWGIYSAQNAEIDVTHNDIKSNQYGLLIDGRGGISITHNDFSVNDENDYAVMVRRGAPEKLEQNNFHFSGELVDASSIFWMLYIQGAEDVIAPHNWWGTIPGESEASASVFIEAYTFDRRDGGGVGRLSYKPFAAEPVEGTVDDLQPPDVRVLQSPVFSPNGDGRVDLANIVYTLSESAAWVRMEVIDERGLTGQGEHAVLWRQEWRAANAGAGGAAGTTGSDPPEVEGGRHVVTWDGTWSKQDEPQLPIALCDLPEGGGASYRVRVTAQDRAHPDDPRMRDVGSATVYVDCDPPDLEITNYDMSDDGSPIPVSKALIDLEGSVLDWTAVGLTVYVQGRQVPTRAASGRFTFSSTAWLRAAGTGSVAVTAVDGAGNEGEQILAFDYNPPITLTVTSPTHQNSVVAKGMVAGAFGDQVASVWVRTAPGTPSEAALSGAEWVRTELVGTSGSDSHTFSSVSPLRLHRGMNALQAEARDSSGARLGRAVAPLEMDPYANRTRTARFLSGRSMITVPMEGKSDHAAVLQLTYPQVSRWQRDERAAASGYVAYGEVGLEPFAPGRGFWLELDAPYEANLTGDLANPDAEFYPVQLHEGWNQIGNPFLSAVAWDDLQVRPADGRLAVSIREAIINGWIANTAWGYWSGTYRPRGNGGRLDPWAGYWIKAYRDVTLRVPGPGGDLGAISQSASGTGIAPRGISTQSSGGPSTDAGWSFHLEAWAGEPLDRVNGERRRTGGATPHAQVRLGVRDGASAGFDPLYDAEAPPAVTGSPQVAVVRDDWDVHSGRYAIDMQGAPRPVDDVQLAGMSTPLGAHGRAVGAIPDGVGWTWEIRVAGGERLRWPNVASVPLSVSLFLVDPAADAVLNLREVARYTLPASDDERRLAIVALSGNGPLELSQIWVYPNPASLEDQVTIAYTLSRPATVRVRIDDAIGRPVLWPTGGRRMPAGRHAFHWDGRSGGGSVVANGIYVVTVSAIDQSGRRTRQVAKIGVLK